jgi:hypothetical protein
MTFQNSKDSIQQSIWNKLEKTENDNNNNSDETLKFSSISDAISNLTEIENLGFVIESSYADFLTAQHCDLASVGQFGVRHYALAFPKGSIYRDPISHQILTYLHDGTMESLRQKWIQKVSKCPNSLTTNAENVSQAYNPTVYSVCE